MTDRAPKFDPALLAIMSNRLETVAKEMINTLLRTARSGVLSIGRDFSCAILTADNRLLVFSESLPIHVGGLNFECEAMIALHGDTLSAGDAFLNNSPYHGGTHHADHTILVPVFVDGTHVMTVCAKAHQGDCGNAVPSTYYPQARDIYEEGALNLPCVRVQQAYRDCDDIIRMCRMRLRVPEQWYGDYLAAIGAARVGERSIEGFHRKYGRETVEAFCEEWFAYSERRMTTEIRQLRAGTWRREFTHDPFPGVPADLRMSVSVSIDPAEGRIVVDLRDNPDALDCGVNLSRATTRAGAVISVLNALDPTIPVNHGSLKCIDVLWRRNAIIGDNEHPISCSTATTNIAHRLLNAVRATMAEARPEYGVAEAGLAQPACYGVISGRDPDRGHQPYVNQLCMGALGGPGTSSCDGWMTFADADGMGLSYRDSIEVDEQKYPIRIFREEVLPDTEGAGRFRGAPGSVVEFGPATSESMVLAYASDGSVHPAGGVNGGLPGGRSEVLRIFADGTSQRLPEVGVVEVQAGERIRSICCGGGGYGPPRDRDRDRVAEDVAEGIVTEHRARAVYGFVDSPSEPVLPAVGGREIDPRAAVSSGRAPRP